MQSKTYKLVEFYLIFILAPISFTLNVSPWVKLAIGCLGFLYIIYILLSIEKEPIKIKANLNWKQFWKATLLKGLVIGIITTGYVWITNKEALFNVVINKPLLWVFILCLYSFFSVYPQELIFRTFYFKRYSNLFNNKWFLIFLNAIVFALAHLFFKNHLVTLFTFLGGLLFAFTYYKAKSTVLVSIEHAIYGCWLFTVGMGSMLGFPA